MKLCLGTVQFGLDYGLRGKQEPSFYPMEPLEMRSPVDGCNGGKNGLCGNFNEPSNTEKNSMIAIDAVKSIHRGEGFTENKIRRIRPVCVRHPGFYPEILEKEAVRDLSFGTAMRKEYIQ